MSEFRPFLFHSNGMTTMECDKFHSQKWSESIHVTHQIDGNSKLITNMIIIKNWLDFIWEIWTNFLMCPNWSDRRIFGVEFSKTLKDDKRVINRIPHTYRLSYHNPPKNIISTTNPTSVKKPHLATGLYRQGKYPNHLRKS